jgi:hypothetical protein
LKVWNEVKQRDWKKYPNTGKPDGEFLKTTF